ncbi:MAG: hypothetical protein ACI9H6_000064 [Patiriisocius sp.]|jgi:hypothetical protein
MKMKTSYNQIQKRIMRRVYYAFGVRLATHSITLHMVVLAVAAYVLTQLVHVASVLENVASVQMGELAGYLQQTLTQADVTTLAVIGIATFTALSLPLRLPNYQKMQTI